MPYDGRPRCKYLLAWAKEHRRHRYCSFEMMTKDIMLEPVELHARCADDCPNYHARWPTCPDPDDETPIPDFVKERTPVDGGDKDV